MKLPIYKRVIFVKPGQWVAEGLNRIFREASIVYCRCGYDHIGVIKNRYGKQGRFNEVEFYELLQLEKRFAADFS